MDIKELNELVKLATTKPASLPYNHMTHEDMKGKVFPLIAYETNYVSNDTDGIERIDVGEIKVLAYDLADGASTKTIVYTRSGDNTRCRSSVDMHFSTKTDANAASVTEWNQFVHQYAIEKLADVALKVMPTLMEFVGFVQAFSEESEDGLIDGDGGREALGNYVAGACDCINRLEKA